MPERPAAPPLRVSRSAEATAFAVSQTGWAGSCGSAGCLSRAPPHPLRGGPSPAGGWCGRLPKAVASRLGRRLAAWMAVSRTRNHGFRDSVRLPAMTPSTRALVRSQSGPHAGSWLSAIPFEPATTPASQAARATPPLAHATPRSRGCRSRPSTGPCARPRR